MSLQYQIAELQRLLANLINYATVVAVDPEAARVQVKSGDFESDWLPWLTQRAGDDRTWDMPTKGEQVLLLCPGGDPANGAVLPALYQNQHAAPAENPAQRVRIYSDGAEIAYDKETHCLSASLPAGGTVVLAAPGGVTITGNVDVTGTVTASADVVGGGKSLKSHKHTAVMPGSGISGEPQ